MFPTGAYFEDKCHDSLLQTRKLRFKQTMYVCPSRKAQGWDSNLHPDLVQTPSFSATQGPRQPSMVKHAPQSLSCHCLSPDAQADAVDDLAGGRLESWLRASIVSAFYNLVLGRGWGRGCFSWELRQGRSVNPAGTQARRTRELGSSQGRPDQMWAGAWVGEGRAGRQ